jgi:hypothetical protein
VFEDNTQQPSVSGVSGDFQNGDGFDLTQALALLVAKMQLRPRRNFFALFLAPAGCASR